MSARPIALAVRCHDLFFAIPRRTKSENRQALQLATREAGSRLGVEGPHRPTPRGDRPREGLCPTAEPDLLLVDRDGEGPREGH
jgi:hypothetical protein